MGLNKKQTGIYANILSDGIIRVISDENDPEAVKREYETSTGEKGVKYEKEYNELEGYIIGLNFWDGNFGTILQIFTADTPEDKENAIILCVNMNSSFASDVLKKLPNINLEEQVKFVPYAFEGKNGKTKKGITIYQNGEKLTDFFHDEKYKALNGFPEVNKTEAKKYDTDDWKIFFTQARKFLKKYTEENFSHLIKKNETQETLVEFEEMTAEKEPEVKSEKPEF